MSKPDDLPGTVAEPSAPPVYNTGVVQPPIQHQPTGYQPMGQPMVQQPYQSATNTTVIINQAAPMTKALRPWSSGLFSCFDDCMTCALVFFCPECFACYLASKAGENCCLPTCVPGWLISLRAHIRGKHQIEGSIMNDCCTVSCCYQCSMCQLAREIDHAKREGQF